MSKDDMQPMYGEPISDWYRYFAWYPVHTWDRGSRWLCFVWKRKCQTHSYINSPLTWFYQYRATKPTKEPKQ